MAYLIDYFPVYNIATGFVLLFFQHTRVLKNYSSDVRNSQMLNNMHIITWLLKARTSCNTWYAVVSCDWLSFPGGN